MVEEWLAQLAGNQWVNLKHPTDEVRQTLKENQLVLAHDVYMHGDSTHALIHTSTHTETHMRKYTSSYIYLNLTDF